MISGSGACHVGAVFLANAVKPKKVWISDPSWINHEIIWERATPGVERQLYPYYHSETKSLDFSGMISCLERESEAGDVIILQACAHNPTGLDPSEEQWKAIADICEKKGIVPFFDSA
jgi:aspartate aminotransferase, cytoplasmic